MSNHIRDKSTRKEAIWRQQTLLAAFTSSGAKQRINTAAGTVVEEIVNAIKHFADPKEEEGIKIAVKRIVKLAAETWRFARLEREMITAIMPALEDEEHEFTGPEYWPTYKPDGTLIGSLAGTAPPSDEQPQLLLRLFPVIYRESKHENFHGDGETRDEGCVFHHGLALYDDADAVVTRMEELRSAGLPSHTIVSTSPTAEHGKFPPLHDICPPPRDPLPSPPAPPRSAHRTAERTSVRSASTSHPSSPTEKSEKTSQRQSNTPPPPPSSIPSLIESMPSKPPIPPKPVTAYKRPPPGPVDFASPRNLIGLVPPVESTFSSNPSTPAKTQGATASTEAPPPAPASEDESASTPAESAIIPHSFSDSTVQESGSKDLPTPPHSPSGTSKRPVSPLFEATDEIEASQSHRSRPSTSLSRRRSTHSKRPTEEELPEVNPRPETIRRTSGYALSTRTSKTVDSERSERTEKSDRTERTEKSEKSGRDPKSKYMCESRSAAVKALYPNSPMATPNGSLKGSSVKSEKKKDRDSRDSTRDSTKDSHRGSKELKREKSIPDNGTWDTNSMSRASFEANTQLSG
jgi:serine/arginine repetitive matrix protein 2